MVALTQESCLPGQLIRARDSVPDDVIASARLHFLDALAVGLAGSRIGPVRNVGGLAAKQGTGWSSVLGSSTKVPAPVAALINGSLIHSLEYDDTHVASVMHGSSVIAASTLAIAEESGASGLEALAAFAIGYEFLIRIGLASPGRIQAQGFQITSAGGAFAAAAVSCLLNEDAPETLTNAIGIAGSQAGGTFAFLANGDTVKAVQPGWAAHSGLLAAELARAGVTGPSEVFDGRFGFFTLYADDPDGGASLKAQLADVGTTWRLPEAAFKLQPCCHYVHPFIEALDELTAQGLTPSNVVELKCFVPSEVIPIIAEPWAARQHPAKAHDARWSLPYVLAAVLRKGSISLSDFDGQCDEEIMALADKVTYEPWQSSGFPARFPARLTAALDDGTALVAVIDDVKGSPTRPASERDVLAKAIPNLLAGGMVESNAFRLADEFLVTDDPDIGIIGELLRLQR